MHERAAASKRYDDVRCALADGRGHEVVFVAHCLLNQNTRYPGGAVCPGAVTAVVQPYLDDGVGIVQMPCPEQRAWGGVLKRRLLLLLRWPGLARGLQPFMPILEDYVRRRYAHLARGLARDLTDYTSGGFRVRAIVGVAGSPSCGVETTMNLREAVAALGGRRPQQRITSDWFNNAVVAPATGPGRGLFMQSLGNALERRHQDVSFDEVSL